ncbi:hypothetical protein DB347_22630 [Opitutaceae bacterium EW11]|nr:hypothetical protein DB347_22630 [Opitutaceae bacterium EW11]
MKYVVVFLSVWIVAYAHLGDTREELEARLGAVRRESNHATAAQGRVHILGPSFEFEKDGWRLRCDMIDGKCVRISYARRGGWTQEQMDTLLEENAQGAKWMLGIMPSKRSRFWDRSDGGRANWESSGRMDFVSPEYTKAQRSLEDELKRKAQEKPKL